MTTESLTYKELAERLGVKLESARKTVLRKKWQKMTGNDGTIRILVPIEALARHDDSPKDKPSDSPSDGLTVRELQAKVEALGELLAVERQRADAEMHRADAAQLDRDRWHELAVKPWWKRLVG